MKINVTTRVDGLQDVRHRFEMISKVPQEVLEETAKVEKAAVEERIRNSKTDPNGRAWAPWSMATMRERQRDGSIGGGLLYKTGALAGSIQYRISEKTMTIFSNTPYSKYLQFGTPKMEARPFLGWSRESLNNIKNLFKEKINK